jgi:hypothetical protein
MQTLNAYDAMPVARARAQQATGDQFPGATHLWRHAQSLWSDEYHAYRTLMALGMHDAAECAWQRRTAAADLAHIYITAC